MAGPPKISLFSYSRDSGCVFTGRFRAISGSWGRFTEALAAEPSFDVRITLCRWPAGCPWGAARPCRSRSLLRDVLRAVPRVIASVAATGRTRVARRDVRRRDLGCRSRTPGHPFPLINAG